MVLIPQRSPDHCESIRAGRLCCGVPRRGSSHAGFSLHQRGRPQPHPRRERAQRRRCAGNRPVVPLALRLDPRMRACLCTRHVHRPSPEEPRHELCWRVVKMRTQQGLRLATRPVEHGSTPSDSPLGAAPCDTRLLAPSAWRLLAPRRPTNGGSSAAPMGSQRSSAPAGVSTAAPPSHAGAHSAWVDVAVPGHRGRHPGADAGASSPR